MPRLTQRLGLTRYDADANYKKGLVAYEKRNLDEALINLSDAIEALPNNAEYYAARGYMYLEDGIEDKAEADFAQALKLYPYEMLAHYGRGVIAFREQRWVDALAHFTKAYHADPKRAETLYYLALVLHRQADYAQALDIMKQAQTALEAANDRRKNDAAKWVRVLEKVANAPRLRDGK
ncbi:MAG: tetratricopeptide repeat protein [Armatimonadetes bacterium]|nr:tetratricopeptide repeat protein [Anaerolineae bacterium]